MPNNPNGPIRRAQLIVPFGTGAMLNVPGGTSLVIAGLDFWFSPAFENKSLDIREFRIEEWRMQKLLSVNHFRLPPDYREPYRGAGDLPNLKITVPAFRFPTWHFCPTCKLLTQRSMFERGSKGRIKCPECEAKQKTRYLVQVPFIAICENGHLNDFPWREWVHKSVKPTCNGKLRLISTGSATLGGQKVKCDNCKAERNLAGITSASESSHTTTLTTSLSEKEEFTCPGERPWLGPDGKENCLAPVRGSLRSALNVYFGQVRSSIYLPRTDNTKIESLLPLLENPPLSSLVKMLVSLKATNEQIIESLRSQQGTILLDYSDEEIIFSIDVIKNDIPADDIQVQDDAEDDPTKFRKEEFEVLRIPRNEDLLKIKQTSISDYGSDITQYFTKLMLVDKLRETRALSGFTRVYAENDQNIAQRKSMLWKDTSKIYSWLPAYIVYGEGIFLEFGEDSLHQWEKDEEVQERVKTLAVRYRLAQERRKLKYRPIGPRYVLIHTFAHLLMNRLTFECGYSSAALRERLYVSDDPNEPMAGLLIYTADGDAEGTMGGLVRMGKPGNLEPVIKMAIDGARWCSADPVCMEMGKLHGQGPDSCNLAACHNCALVPETACEEFNRFLDRGVVVGDIGRPSIGFFNR
jgi:hypothetical protein